MEIDDSYNQEDTFEEFNITNSWLKNIFESLKRFEELEKICRDGGDNIIEYLNLDPSRLPNIQFQHLRMMITEADILLNNVRPRIRKEFFQQSKIKIREIKEIVDVNSNAVLKFHSDQRNHTEWYNLTNLFYVIIDELSEIRAMIVLELSRQGILFAKTIEKSSSLDKDKKVKLYE